MRKLGTSFLLALFVLVIGGHAKDPVLPTEVLHATYVALGYETAQGFIGETDEEAFISAKILPADRDALNNVHNELANWKRYIITITPRDAELLIAVRSGRVASVNGGVHIGTIPVSVPPAGRGGIGPVFGAEAGPPNDYLAVYRADKGREGPPLWKKSEEDGLVGKNPSLFESFRRDVEALAKKYPKH